MWVGITAVGMFETRDGGATWEPRNKGVRADFVPGPAPETGQCVHKFVMAAGEPETLYQQNHCGAYRSTDGGATWTDLTTNGLPSQFGFPLVTHPRDPQTFWVIPLTQPEEGRFMPEASAAVWRTRDRGDTWTRERRRACRRRTPTSACSARRWLATRSTRSGSRSGRRPASSGTARTRAPRGGW